MIFLTKEISETILIKRKENRLSQKELAEMVGVNYTVISRIELGKYEKVEKDLLIKIFNMLCSDLSYIIKKQEILDNLNIVLDLYLEENREENYLQLKREIISNLLKD